MNRTTFIQSILAAGAGALIPEWTQSRQKVFLLQCFVAGFSYYHGPKLFPEMKEGDALQIVREPENPHDRFAIALHWKNNKIGFIPAINNEVLARLLDAEVLPLQAEIAFTEPTSEPWENVHLAVYCFQPLLRRAKENYLHQIEKPEYATGLASYREDEGRDEMTFVIHYGSNVKKEPTILGKYKNMLKSPGAQLLNKYGCCFLSDADVKQLLPKVKQIKSIQDFYGIKYHELVL